MQIKAYHNSLSSDRQGLQNPLEPLMEAMKLSDKAIGIFLDRA